MPDASKNHHGRGRSNAPQQVPRRPAGDTPPISQKTNQIIPDSKFDNVDARMPTVSTANSNRKPKQGIGRGAVRNVATAGPSAAGTPRDAGAVGGERGLGRPPNIVTRPTSSTFTKIGTGGSPLDVRSNHFQLVNRPDMHLLQYRVDFTPEIDHPGVKKALIRVHEPTVGKYIFDGTLLYNTIRLPQPLELLSRRTSDGSDVRITLNFTNEIQAGDPVYVSFMNLILRHCLAKLNMVMMRRNYYDAGAKEDVPGHPITIWPGYLTAIAHHEQACLLNVEIVHKFIRRDTALHVMDRIRREVDHDIPNRIKSELIGQIVMTGYNNRTYRIDDVDFDQNASSTFHLRKEDRHISYVDYYRERYQITITVVTQPLLVSKPTRREINRGDTEPKFLIPELCGMTGLSDEQRKNFNLTRAVAGITKVFPDRRVETLMRFRRRLTDCPEIQQELNSWGVQFSNELVRCQARILQPKGILTGGARTEPRDGDWSRTMQSSKMCVSVKLENWIVIHPTMMSQQVRNFVRLIQRVGGPQGFDVPEPRYVSLENDRNNNYANALENELSNHHYDIVMCVLRSNRADTYKVIKNITFCRLGIASQVITGRILNGDERRQLSVATKVMTQIACKLGAEPWRVDVPNKPWMIAGYDTYHDAHQRKAVGAFVASVNSSYTRYNSSVKIHENNEEISPSFQDHMLTSLKAYYNANKSLPENIIIYRDGVGAGDIGRLLETELVGVKRACETAGVHVVPETGYRPGIAFVVVTKRLNTRFFSGSRERPENPPCGTVVDNTVTLSENFDFFLVSQKVNQGTVSPTKFNIIFNSSNIPATVHQNVAYAMTQVYYNWAGTLRVPAPVQYAHKLAYLVGESIGNTPKPELAKYPYYL